jgi:hypothetical protein
VNNQTYKIHWRLVEDLPAEEGLYYVCFRDKHGFLGGEQLVVFRKGEWEFLPNEDPAFWTSVPLPKDN